MVSVQRDLHHGLGFLVSYTRSKDITDSDSLEEGSGFDAGTQIIQNPLNLRGEKAISLQDLPNILVMSYVYELPFGKGRRFANPANGLVNEIIRRMAIQRSAALPVRYPDLVWLRQRNSRVEQLFALQLHGCTD